jgi:nucleotide-binding universal stress UspA family protein
MLHNILVPLDGSPVADLAIPHAAAIARRSGVGLHLVRVHVPVIPRLGPDAVASIQDPTLEEKLIDQSREWILARAEAVRAETGLPVTWTFHVGPIVDEIVAAARRHDPAIIVCTTHGSGGWLLHGWGSIAQELVRRAACPVLVMSESAVQRGPDVRRLMLLLDGTERATAILPVARWMAKSFDAEIQLMQVAPSVWPAVALADPIAAEADAFGIAEFSRRYKDEIEKIATNLRSEGLRASSFVNVRDDVGDAIFERIDGYDPDMVAIATHGRGIARILTGSMADRIVRKGSRPTLCYRAA